MTSPSQAYFQTQVGTTNQGELLLMLYDGALKFLTMAKERMLAKDVAAKGMLISKALDIINELDNVLDMQEGGDLAKNLHQLYFMCISRLLQANLKQDPDKLDSVMEILKGLRSAYAQILQRPEAQAAAAHIASKQKGRSAMTGRAGAPMMAPVQAPGAGLGRAQANQMYSQVQNQVEAAPSLPASVPVPPPVARTAAPASAPVTFSGFMPPTAPASPVPSVTGTATAPPARPTPTATPGLRAENRPVAPAQKQPVAASPANGAEADAPAKNAPAAPANPQATAGFGSRRLAASAFYAKQS